MAKLKPCPFCGSDDLIVCESKKRAYFYVSCYECGAECGGCEGLEEAIEEWNRRVKEDGRE